LSNLTKGLILVVAIIAVGVGLVIWKKKVGGHDQVSFNSITKEEIELLLSDAAKTNPMALKKLGEDPEMRKQQLDSLKQLLAFASQAQKEGLTDDPANRHELESIRNEIIAVNYDKEINQDKGPMPQLGFITEDQVKAYWGEDDAAAVTGKGFFEKIGLAAEHRRHDAEFQEFLDSKIKLLKASNPQMANREISDQEKDQAKEYFAKVQIYKKEFDDKAASGELKKDFVDKVNLQVKLQQAQFLARLYSDKLAEKTKVTDEEVAKYISEHAELDPAQKKAKAQGILDRAKNGEDFAKLANEFTEDPGNKDPKGELQGGLYKDVKKGQMVPPFEQAALALEPGQVAPELVESDFGYHIIKLEKKGETKDSKGQSTPTYDVRHILIATTYKDPENPAAREMPVKEYVRQKLEQEKEKKLIDDMVAENHIQVPDDFSVPQVTDEQIQEMMKKQQAPPGMQPGGEEGPPPPAPKPETKKGK
jgi:parvulin-like peptidyl-prolyl isomerase